MVLIDLCLVLHSITQNTFNCFQESSKAFVDREHELKELAKYAIITLQNGKVIDKNNILARIAVTSQMWGSGKSTLGQRFISSLRENLYSIKEYLLENVNLRKYDLNEFSKDLETDIEKLATYKTITLDYKALFLDKLNCLSGQNIEINWDRITLVTLYNIVLSSLGLIPEKEKEITVPSLLELIKGHRFFFHFDEIDLTISKDGQFLDDIDSARVLYEMWHKIFYPLASKGFPVYISGRSTILLSLHQGLYQAQGVTSPPKSGIVYILLHMFEPKHIEELLKLSSITYPNNEELSKKIHLYTSGVPRLVKYTIQYLELKGKPDLDIHSLMHYFNSILMSYEILAISDTKLVDKFYFELIRLSVFRIPFDINKNIICNDLWSTKNTYVPAFRLIQHYHVYIQPIQNPYVLITVPLVTIYEIISKLKKLTQTDPTIAYRISQFESLRDCIPIFRGSSKGDLMEHIFASAISNRLLFGPMEVGNKEPVPESLIFFYISKDLLKGKVDIQPEVLGIFPKFVSKDKCKQNQNQNQTGSTEMPKSKLIEYIKSSKVHVLYKCAPQSESCDFYLKLNPELVIGYCIKNLPSRGFGLGDLQKEIEKSTIIDDTIKLIFVVVSTNNSKQFESYPPSHIIKHGDDIVSYQYDPEYTFKIQKDKDWMTPNNLYTVILTPKGIEILIDLDLNARFNSIINRQSTAIKTWIDSQNIGEFLKLQKTKSLRLKIPVNFLFIGFNGDEYQLSSEKIPTPQTHIEYAFDIHVSKLDSMVTTLIEDAIYWHLRSEMGESHNDSGDEEHVESKKEQLYYTNPHLV
ncbi:hypothetical protein DLAC_03407 [Tieghemostelium lacteum]|uniref:Uncharacterized protein n=1 Tax=Tieghemostelium lacteum TaxID=361077 RepID=A0A152A1Z5_TIELA|nr:hypothetical protein DLAC_03407 [Tieghemostelium lacteum]|eukprot:KYR00246.1 hypothetical protein DLAC_03407 [Tieghemostelium lacteum]